jgi:Cof subfamily protein (haloacid dehalogenase superfamily)
LERARAFGIRARLADPEGAWGIPQGRVYNPARRFPLTDHAHDLDELARLRPRPDVRLIAADMDGTLVDDAKQIPGELWPLVDELHARGIAFCPASGRQYHNLVLEFGEHARQLVFIADSGAYVLDGAGREISSDCLGLEVSKRVAAVVRGIPEAGAIVCGKRSAWIERKDRPFVEEVSHYYAKLRIVDDLLQVEDEVLKVAIYDFTSGEHNTAPRLSEFRTAHQVVVSGPHWVDVLSPSASKGRALRQLQAALGVTADQTMAFGDFLNDLEMMDAATWSFAVENAHPLLKERARYLAPANNANGVVRTIRTVLGLPVPVSVRGTPAP